MDFDTLRAIENEAEQVNRTYDIFNEDQRLNHSKAAQVEFLTVAHCIEESLRPGMRILDLGVGAGEYSLYFARQGYTVDAVELADNNIRAFREKLTDDLPVRLVQGNALDLSAYADKSFDVVLLMGPLYHLYSAEDRRRCIRAAGVIVEREIASDGASELMAERINGMSDVEYARYLKYHFMICEKPEQLGFSNHLLFVGRKG